MVLDEKSWDQQNDCLIWKPDISHVKLFIDLHDIHHIIYNCQKCCHQIDLYCPFVGCFIQLLHIYLSWERDPSSEAFPFPFFFHFLPHLSIFFFSE